LSGLNNESWLFRTNVFGLSDRNICCPTAILLLDDQLILFDSPHAMKEKELESLMLLFAHPTIAAFLGVPEIVLELPHPMKLNVPLVLFPIPPITTELLPLAVFP